MDQDDALIQRVPSQETILPRHARSSNGRALKVAGLTVLACLLLAGQALTAYFVWGQRDHIKALTEGQEKLKTELSRKPSAGAPRMMQLPMKSMRLMLNDDKEKNAPKAADVLKTQCQLGSDRKVQPGFYSPQCDDQGNYLPKQCWHSTGYCWCVDNEGKEITGTRTRERLQCDSDRKTLQRPLRRISEMKETLPLMKLQPTHQNLREGSGLQEASVQALPVMRKMQSPIAMMPLLDEKSSEDSAE